MLLISWNVNGIRAALKKELPSFIKKKKPDIFCIQETKAMPEQVEHPFQGYHECWNWAEKKGYSGTATFSKDKPLSVSRGIGKKEHDREGRVLTTEFKSFYLVNVYTPNSKRDLSRLDYRQEWDRAFLDYCRKLEKKKPVIFCGDLNVAHQEIDLTHPKANRRNHGFTDEERSGFDRIVRAGFIDTFRVFENGGGHYTWWSQMSNARSRNVGWRIDYFCVSAKLKSKLKKAGIYPEVMGSDHAPVFIELK